MNRFTKSIALFSLALLSACTTPVIGLLKDPGFTYPAILSGHMAIGGVTSSLEPLDSWERSLYGRILLDRLQKKRQDYSVLSSERVARAMGVDAHNEMLDQYRESGAVPDVFLKKIDQNIKDARYVIFARIEGDDVERNIEEEIERFVTKRDKDGKPLEETSRVKEKYVTTRTVSVSFAVYDLESDTPAWSGVIIEGASRTNVYSDSNDSQDNSNDSFWRQLFKSMLLKAPSRHRYHPNPATLREVLIKVFSGFAGNMPGMKSFLPTIFESFRYGESLPPPEPLGPQRGVVGISVKTRAPLRIVIDKADEVYFVKADEAGDLYAQGRFIRSNYFKDGQVYLLNAKPGHYAAIACYKRKPFINFEALSFFSRELIRLTEVTVTAGTIVFMGEYVVDQSCGLKGGDDAQLHYVQLTTPGANLRNLLSGPSGEYYYKGAPQNVNRNKQSEIKFLTNALEHFKDTDWINIIQNRLKELKAGE